MIKYIGVAVSENNNLSAEIEFHKKKCKGLLIEIAYNRIFRYKQPPLFSVTITGR